MEFDKQLSLNLMIDKLVMAIQEVKIKLLDLLQPEKYLDNQ